MPLTPFHFGPTLLFGYPLRRRLDLGTFLVASVILDVRAILVFFGILSGPQHGLLHNTLLGAFAVAVVFAGCVLLFARQFPWVANHVSSRPESALCVLLASVAGTWSHVILDAFTHPEMQLFYPLPGNPLYGLIDPFTIYGLCALSFLLFMGFVGITILRTVRNHGLTYYRSQNRIWKVSVTVGIVIGVTVGVVAAAGAVSTINAVSGIRSPEVTVERINESHAAVSWTTDKPTTGHLRIDVSHHCGPAWGQRIPAKRFNDSSVGKTHLVIAPIYDLPSDVNRTIGAGKPVKWYQVEAVSVGEREVVGTTVINRNLSQTCQ
ncbi:DUF4184 family protein [Haladaptatus sp. CMAA 1911]|uniref:DUF4184 family protein n=1 Tax=unclassified Haladaptatus TaxID=2622732 RepID=UPI0037549490